jgi:CheY-like chemotaxis protein
MLTLAKILVVEDNANNMRLINQVIQDISENIEIFEADSGEKAILISKDQQYDLVIMDIALPDMDGVQIAKLLKTYPQFNETPFIAATAYARINDEKIFRQVFDDYISKPIDEDALTEKVRGWIGAKI